MQTTTSIRAAADEEMFAARFFLAEARDAERHGNQVWAQEMHVSADYHFRRADALYLLARPLPLLDQALVA